MSLENKEQYLQPAIPMIERIQIFQRSYKGYLDFGVITDALKLTLNLDVFERITKRCYEDTFYFDYWNVRKQLTEYLAFYVEHICRPTYEKIVNNRLCHGDKHYIIQLKNDDPCINVVKAKELVDNSIDVAQPFSLKAFWVFAMEFCCFYYRADFAVFESKCKSMVNDEIKQWMSINKPIIKKRVNKLRRTNFNEVMNKIKKRKVESTLEFITDTKVFGVILSKLSFQSIHNIGCISFSMRNMITDTVSVWSEGVHFGLGLNIHFSSTGSTAGGKICFNTYYTSVSSLHNESDIKDLKILILYIAQRDHYKHLTPCLREFGISEMKYRHVGKSNLLKKLLVTFNDVLHKKIIVSPSASYSIWYTSAFGTLKKTDNLKYTGLKHPIYMYVIRETDFFNLSHIFSKVDFVIVPYHMCFNTQFKTETTDLALLKNAAGSFYMDYIVLLFENMTEYEQRDIPTWFPHKKLVYVIDNYSQVTVIHGTETHTLYKKHDQFKFCYHKEDKKNHELLFDRTCFEEGTIVPSFFPEVYGIPDRRPHPKLSEIDSIFEEKQIAAVAAAQNSISSSIDDSPPLFRFQDS